MTLNFTAPSNSMKCLVKFISDLYILKLVFLLEIAVQNCQRFWWNEIKALHFPLQPYVGRSLLYSIMTSAFSVDSFYMAGNLVACVSSDDGP